MQTQKTSFPNMLFRVFFRKLQRIISILKHVIESLSWWLYVLWPRGMLCYACCVISPLDGRTGDLNSLSPVQGNLNINMKTVARGYFVSWTWGLIADLTNQNTLRKHRTPCCIQNKSHRKNGQEGEIFVKSKAVQVPSTLQFPCLMTWPQHNHSI